MFDEAEGLDDPYFRTKHDSEGLVRKEKRIKWRIYRPGMVVGHSQTGEIDKIDGPYYFFTLIKKLREMLPQWMPTLGIEGGRINIVPVDFVVDAMDHIAHKPRARWPLLPPDRPGAACASARCSTPSPAPAHAPEMTMRMDARMFAFVPAAIRTAVGNLPPVKRFIGMLLRDFGIPKADAQVHHLSRRASTTARPSARSRAASISVPPLEGYAWRLWDYWERHLDPDLFVDRSLRGKVEGQGGADHRRFLGHRPGRPRSAWPKPARTRSSSRAARKSCSRHATR